ncbi:phage tail assembly protein [Brevibacillus centrosporus]|uniref:phage tail assembly protein n=2 Tax=Brevibacillus centrosporus TaxID=54910 RepID=UPI0016068B29|nr:phage tail assembly protein [Brevibacillus centrosporus]MEC2128133.1 phage tail assembly protein [Brevibacillus centrosporus]
MHKEDKINEEVNTNEENPSVVETDADDAYRLSKPIDFEGERITKLDLRFDELTGKDLILCAKQARRIDPQEIHPGRALTLSYQIAVAAKAAGVPTEMFDQLKGDDFTIVTQMAENFLLRRG